MARLYINLDDSIGVEVEDIKQLLDYIIDFTLDIFGPISSKSAMDALQMKNFKEFADAYAYSNQHKEPLSTIVEKYSKALTKIKDSKKLGDSLNGIQDLNTILSEQKINLKFRLEL